VIWLLAIEVVMNDLSNIANFLAFAFGFAMGTYIGLVIEEKLIIGMVIHTTTEEKITSEYPANNRLLRKN
jgi:uncharacterized protein YebE (UPF0316 family)